MKSLFDFFLLRLPAEIQQDLKDATFSVKEKNPNDQLQKGTVTILKRLIEEKQLLENKLINKEELLKTEKRKKGLVHSIKKRRMIRTQKKQTKREIVILEQLAFQVACLSCYLTQKMKASEDYLESLKLIKHPYIELFVTYFEENPSNYEASYNKIKRLARILEAQEDFTKEMKANLINIQSWIYGQQGDIGFIKELYKYTQNRIKETTNLIEQFALQDCALNIIWWMLHSGLESNIEEMMAFIKPYVQKYHLYKNYTTFLNVQGAIDSYFGNNKKALECFEKLKLEHEKYHDTYRLSIAIGNASETYFVMGKVLKACTMMEEAIKLYKESTDSWPYLYLTEIGNIYYLLGETKKAEQSILQAYEIQKKDKSMHKAFILFELIHFYLRIENLLEAEKYLEELRLLAKDLHALSVNAQVDYLFGFYELLDQNFSNAIKYLQIALQKAQKTKDMELILLCNSQLTAAYLQKYRLSEQQKHLNLALNFIDTVIQLAIENYHNQILSIALMIRSILRATKGEFQKARKDIEKAQKISKKYDMKKWSEDVEKVEELIARAQTKQKMELKQQHLIETLLPQFKSMLSMKLVERKQKEVKILGMLVISKSGVPIYTKLKSNLQANRLLLSGMLTAIDNLAHNILEGKDRGRLKDISYEDFAIILHPIKDGLIAIIASEATADVRMWAGFIAERVKEVPVVISEITSQLEENIGDLLEQMKI
ncbi:MAG: hypothetical protein GF308_09645 [Candidatus Heimdallarchaeota archaeon]|nr:hypothetical protein [Candidatus Heimdallarchaeota archaeon]